MGISERERRWSGWALMVGPGIVVTALTAWIVHTRSGELGEAIGRCAPLILVAATLAHLATLVLRSEAWRLTLHAVAGDTVRRSEVHAANAGAFLAGVVQSHAAMPTRVALLTRLSGSSGPSLGQIVLADAPIFVIEVGMLAALAVFACPALGLAWWTPVLILAGALAVLAALRAAHVRFRHRAIAGGLAILADPVRRARLLAVVGALTAIALLRVWLILLGFGLPADPAVTVLLLISLGAIGLLPLGLGTGPAATVAALGAGGIGTAAAAGLAVSASTLVAVLLYGFGAWAWTAARTARDRIAEPEMAEVIALPLPGSTAIPAAPGADLDLAA